MTCRDWLVQNGYEDVAAVIDEAIAKIKAKGSKQRRNWWDILSGDAEGNPCVREGIEFPVLRVAQVRQGKPVTANAISRKAVEEPPDVRATGRWPGKTEQLPDEVKRPAPRRASRPQSKTQRKTEQSKAS